MEKPIIVNFEYTDNIHKTSKWLNSLPKLFAADFEVASKWSNEEKKNIKYKLDNYNLNKEEYRLLMQQYTSDGLSHPSLTEITHLSVAWSDRDAYVIICNSDEIRNIVYKYLITTENTQIWHNLGFDGYHIYHHTHKFPKHYIDTQLLAKSLLNDANPMRDNTKLKYLMAYYYGDWAVAKDNFNQSEMNEEYMLKYSATDACATYKLYQEMEKELQGWRL